MDFGYCIGFTTICDF